jgi:hypothetical protein
MWLVGFSAVNFCQGRVRIPAATWHAGFSLELNTACQQLHSHVVGWARHRLLLRRRKGCHAPCTLSDHNSYLPLAGVRTETEQLFSLIQSYLENTGGPHICVSLPFRSLLGSGFSITPKLIPIRTRPLPPQKSKFRSRTEGSMNGKLQKVA